jgi:hypothetical protein
LEMMDVVVDSLGGVWFWRNHTKELMPRRAVKVVVSAPPSRTVAHPLPP